MNNIGFVCQSEKQLFQQYEKLKYINKLCVALKFQRSCEK